jgi:hypothetical protein
VWQGDGTVIVNWMGSDLTITDGHYRCPRCGEFELRFGTNAGNHSLAHGTDRRAGHSGSADPRRT